MMVVHYKRHIDWFLEHKTPKGVIIDLVQKYKQATDALKDVQAESLENDLTVEQIHKLLLLIGALSLNDLN